MAEKVITRIAPSPTGEMHIGTVRTALYNYLFAKQHGGTYFVRIEDTDRERNKPEWMDAIWRDFSWIGLQPDTKYVQSDHLERHKELLQKLIGEDKAYVSREPKKDDPNQEVEVVRLRNPGKSITFNDLIHGKVSFDTAELGDFVIARSVDDPLYHFAVVADDGDAGVTHVIRAEEHISNTPRQMLIIEALGFTQPQYAHIPLILAPDRTKLSKRKHAASVEQYRAQGFIPEAMLNYLAFLGWNPGGEREIYTLSELVDAFSLEDVHKSGAVFDLEKMRWFNKEHLKLLSEEEYARRLREFIEVSGERVPEYFEAALPLVRERAETLLEAATLLTDECAFFGDIESPSRELLTKGAKVSAQDVATHLKKAADILASLHEGFSAENAKSALMPYADEVGRAAVLWPLRVALSGKEKSPDPFTIMALLGREKIAARIASAIQNL